MISRRTMIAASSLGLGLGFVAAPRLARAEQKFLDEAIAETKEAIEAGKQSQSASFTDHATRALERARSAVWQNPTDNIRNGIKALRKAIKLAKGTSSEAKLAKAVEQATLALSALESAQ